MKRLLSLFLALILTVSCCGCSGNWETVDLSDPIAIPDNGMITESILAQIKEDRAIGVFTGKSGNLKYDWTIFGSDIDQATPINLQVMLTPDKNSLSVTLVQGESFGFSALLSVYLDTTWNAQSATAYADGKAIASVSITGSTDTILNLILDGSVQTLEIRPDPMMNNISLSGASNATEPETTFPESGNDSYLSRPEDSDGTVYTGDKDKYLTDPIPEGMPHPVEPEDQDINRDNVFTCTFSIECSTILNNLSMLDPDKLEMVPSGGVILATVTVTFYEGESVFDVLQRICRERGIHMEAEWTPIYNSAYVEGIHNLYEFDCGPLSGWMYQVNGWYPNYGCSRYQLKDGDVVQWRYTCDLGKDIGGDYAVGG